MCCYHSAWCTLNQVNIKLLCNAFPGYPQLNCSLLFSYSVCTSLPLYTVGFRLLKRCLSRSCSGVWPTLRWSLPGVCWSEVLMWFLCSCRAGIPKCFCLLPPALHDFWWFCFPLSLYHLHLINLSGLALCLYIPSLSLVVVDLPNGLLGSCPFFSQFLPLHCLTTQILGKLRCLLLGLHEAPALFGFQLSVPWLGSCSPQRNGQL